jgi:transcriptional regulator with XRE-family HTH domain
MLAIRNFACTVTRMQSPHGNKISLKRQVYDAATRHAGLITGKAKAEAFDCSRGGLSRIENGHVTPSPEFMAAVCDALGLGLDDLFTVHRKRGQRAA